MTETNPSYRAGFDKVGIHMEVDACLALRPASVGCDLCTNVCPASAINWDDSGVTFSEACVGCGRCAAACPTGAVTLRGFEVPVAPALVEASELFLECRRVPPALRHANAHVVPCLGGLTPLRLLEWIADGHVPVLIEHGWCASCPAGSAGAASTTEAVAQALSDARSALGDVAMSGTNVPRIEMATQPLSRALPLQNVAQSAAAGMGRRGFFATLRGGARSVVAAYASPHYTPTRAACRPSDVLHAHRARRTHALSALAVRAGRTLSATAFPALKVNSNCSYEGVCAAACPSGALLVVEAGGAGVGLDFDASSCIGCGLCATLCPHGALSVDQAGGSETLPASIGPVALIRHPLTRCVQCDDTFVTRDDSSRCPRCTMAQQQARNLFGTVPAAGTEASSFL